MNFTSLSWVVSGVPIAVYAAIVLLGVGVSYRTWKLRAQLWTTRTAIAYQFVIWGLIGEGVLYGFGRYLGPVEYMRIINFWPVVLGLKMLYVIGFSIKLLEYAKAKHDDKA